MVEGKIVAVADIEKQADQIFKGNLKLGRALLLKQEQKDFQDYFLFSFGFLLLENISP